MYQYKAVDPSGYVLTNNCEGTSKESISEKLRTMGYAVEAIKIKKEITNQSHRKKIKQADLASICRRFSAMYGAGLSVMECLSTLSVECESSDLRTVLTEISTAIGQGRGVSESFKKYPHVFPPFFIHMIHVGETSGNFEFALDEMDKYLEKQLALKRKIKQALSYPVIVLGMIFLVVTVMMFLVIPVFTDVYLKMGITLPMPTVILMTISNNAATIIPAFIGFVIFISVAYRKAMANKRSRLQLDKWKFGLPLLGSLLIKITLLRFVRTLGLMIKAGVSISEGLEVSSRVANNQVAKEATDMIIRSINNGGTLTQAVEMHNFFPKSVVYAFSAGETTGDLDIMLGKISSSLEKEVDDGIQALLGKLEPIITLVLSSIVGFILIAIYLPIFDLIKATRAG